MASPTLKTFIREKVGTMLSPATLPPTRYMFAAMAAPGPWLPLQVEGWLSSLSQCRSCVSTAAAVCWKMVD